MLYLSMAVCGRTPYKHLVGSSNKAIYYAIDPLVTCGVQHDLFSALWRSAAATHPPGLEALVAALPPQPQPIRASSRQQQQQSSSSSSSSSTVSTTIPGSLDLTYLELERCKSQLQTTMARCNQLQMDLDEAMPRATILSAFFSS